jgi:hypothetical protein
MKASSTTTIRVSVRTRKKLHDVARSAGLPMQELVERALDLYRRQQILDETNRAYADLRADPTLWKQIQSERNEWDVTLDDGLDDK